MPLVFYKVGEELSGVSERPSGQYLKDIVRPALAWRIEQLNCPEAKRPLARSIVR